MSEKEIGIIIPISQSEPLSVIRRSADHLRQLDRPQDYTLNILYAIDSSNPDSDERVTFLREQEDPVQVLVRSPNNGPKAAAINDALEELDYPALVGLFDVDSRPSYDFLVQTLPAIQKEDVFLASGSRTILNSDTNSVTKMVDTEFSFLTDAQSVLHSSNGFCLFNGALGLLDGEYLQKKGFSTDVICEDTDLTNEAYQDGKRAVMVEDTTIGEQAPHSLTDLYPQKVRWMTGAVESLQRHRSMLTSRQCSLRVKLSWLIAMTMPFFAILFSPLTFLYTGLRYGRHPTEAISRGAAAAILMSVISASGISATWKSITDREISWDGPERQPV